ncbi:MAG: glutathione S-transferase N-terminal domain-containing protein, partial [Deltaproteobacteria bacterium]|nr:glutathione S-transferase N-terminal domain-containing protein [Deltaproteobacteria bacterium]
MLELHTWDSPNGEKIHIALEELALEVDIVAVDLRAGDQRRPEFLELNPPG